MKSEHLLNDGQTWYVYVRIPNLFDVATWVAIAFCPLVAVKFLEVLSPLPMQILGLAIATGLPPTLYYMSQRIDQDIGWTTTQPTLIKQMWPLIQVTLCLAGSLVSFVFLVIESFPFILTSN